MHPSLQFARTLCGHYSNREQAQGDPSKFAHINVFFLPLPWEVLQGPGFYSEQSYDHDPWRPYRQGVHRLRRGDQGLHIVENFGLVNPERVAGAPQHRSLLTAIQPDTLKPRCGCAMHFRSSGEGSYRGEVEPGKGCKVPRDGRLTYLVSEVDVTPTTWSSRDRGFDPETDAPVWGSEHGMLRFTRLASLADHLDDDWLEGLEA
ncbi:MAG: chromophore lyase CpcT/CpeT [Synechococcus sp.]